MTQENSNAPVMDNDGQITEKPFVEGESPNIVGEVAASTLDTAVPETLAASAKEEDSTSFDHLFNKVGKITIKPFTDPNKENMGLEKLDMVVFPGIEHEEQIAAIERNGVVKFVTGLDEFAPEVKLIKDKETKAGVVRNIRLIVQHLEQELATNILDIKDPEFWAKVEIAKPNNIEFWGGLSIRVGNEQVALNPATDPYDLIKFMAIEAGGFDLIAKSFEDAMSMAVAPKWYLDKEVDTVSTRTTFKKLRNKAIGLLDAMHNGNATKLMYVTKIIDTNSTAYKAHTPIDIMYDLLDDYINGEGIERNKTKAAEHFIEISRLDPETLKVRALVKDSVVFNHIALKADGMLYHTATNTMLGRNVSDVVQYLKNPLYEDMLVALLGEIDEYWKS